jgi:cytidine deaminase
MMRADILIDHALEAQKRAYAPFSNYPVGAALLTGSDNVIYGCNVESKAYPTTLCAERVAVFSAISQGYTDFKAIAVVTNDGATPCGSCRQVIHELCGNIPVHISDVNKKYETVNMNDLLPHPFG